MITMATPQDRAQQLFSPRKTLSEEQALQLAQEDPQALAYLFLLVQARLHPAPHTPSGMTPVYEKPAASPRTKKPGRPAGHAGVHRPTPPRIDARVPLHLEVCPDCGGPLTPCTGKHGTRTRIVEDIPPDLQPVVTEYTLERAYCPACHKLVEPKVPEALPGSALGNRVLTLFAYWHYGLGLPLSQVVQVLSSHLHFLVSEGGLIQMGQRLARILEAWYEELALEVQRAAVLNADETGWRVNGHTAWLWCFATPTASVYFIDRSRGSPALLSFFREGFDGFLVTDFWAAYDRLTCDKRQCCLAHLLRELEKVDAANASAEWGAFSKKAKRLFRDALRLYHREGYRPQDFASRIERLQTRLIELMLTESTDADVQRLAKRLQNYWLDLLTFLEHPEVPPTNNQAEREIRPAVVMRKVMQGNRSERGAHTQAVLMSIFRTLKRRGLDPLTEVLSALRHYSLHQTLPPFPPSASIR